MNICTKNKPKEPIFKQGNLYQYLTREGIFMYSKDGKGICLNDGRYPCIMTDDKWVDVTDQYCLQEVK